MIELSKEVHAKIREIISNVGINILQDVMISQILKWLWVSDFEAWLKREINLFAGLRIAHDSNLYSFVQFKYEHVRDNSGEFA